jgi:hypothetical protein
MPNAQPICFAARDKRLTYRRTGEAAIAYAEGARASAQTQEEARPVNLGIPVPRLLS